MIFLEFLFFPCSVMFFMLHPKMSKAVPPNYCFHQLNKSDCNVKPTPVFSYYHPGSRCELETWRGCPTYNKFDDEYQCSSTCIFKHRWDSSENKILKYETTEANEKLYFKEEKPKKTWKDEMESLSREDIKFVDQLLDDVLDDLTTTSTIKTVAIDTTKATETELIPETTTMALTTTEELTTIPQTTDTTELVTEAPKTQAPTTTESTTTPEPITTEATTKEDDIIRPTTKPTPVTDKVTTAEILTTTPTIEATTTVTTTTAGDPEEVIIM